MRLFRPILRRPIRRLSIGTVLLVMTLAALALPVSGLWFLRLYESALLRQTESELISQAGVVAAVYRDAWRRAGGWTEEPGLPVDPPWTHPPGFDAPWTPRFAGLDLAEDPILPAAPDPTPAAAAPNSAAQTAGASLAPILREAQRVTLAGMRVSDPQGIVVASTGEDLGLSLAAQEEVRHALAGNATSVLRERTSRYQARAEGSVAPERSRSLRIFTAHPVLDEGRVVGVVVPSRTPRSLADTLYGKRWQLAGLAVVLLASVGVLGASRDRRHQPPAARRDRAGQAHGGRRARRDGPRAAPDRARGGRTVGRADPHGRDAGAAGGLHPRLRRPCVARVQDPAHHHPRHGGTAARPSGHDVGGGAGPLPVAMGAEALESCLANLIENARRHAGPDARVEVALAADDGGAVLRVSDDGPGVSPANAGRIFTPFFTTARQSGGTGLGLAIARGIVEAHGGIIALRPAERGALFEVRLARPDGEA